MCREAYKFKTDTQLNSALRNKARWLHNIQSLELIWGGIDETSGRIKYLYLAKIRLKTPRFSSSQLGTAILSHSKMTLCYGQKLIRELFRPTSIKLAYTDTDSFICLVSNSDWLTLERKTLSLERRAFLRKELFNEPHADLAYSVNPDALLSSRKYLSTGATRSGKLKIEKTGYRAGYFLSLKCYSLGENVDPAETDTSRFKALSTRDQLSPGLFKILAENLCTDLSETKTSLRKTDGISLIECSKRFLTINSRLQYKFKLNDKGECLAFD